MFSPADLLAAAEARFGQAVLRQRVAPGGTASVKELELAKIARGVIARVQGAAEQADSWPLPGVWPPGSVSPADGTTSIAGQAYADIWPDDLMQRALDLFDYRAYGGLEAVPASKVTMGKAAEQYFFNVARGVEALTVGGSGEPTSAHPTASRDRMGNSLVADTSMPRKNVLDTFIGPGWDFFTG